MLSQYGVINLYKHILNILNQDPTYYINKDEINGFIELRYLKLGFFINHPHWLLNPTTVIVCYQLSNTQGFCHLFHATILDSHYFYVCGLEIYV